MNLTTADLEKRLELKPVKENHLGEVSLCIAIAGVLAIWYGIENNILLPILTGVIVIVVSLYVGTLYLLTRKTQRQRLRKEQWKKEIVECWNALFKDQYFSEYAKDRSFFHHSQWKRFLDLQRESTYCVFYIKKIVIIKVSGINQDKDAVIGDVVLSDEIKESVIDNLLYENDLRKEDIHSIHIFDGGDRYMEGPLTEGIR